MANKPTTTTEAVETESLQIEDIIESDAMFNAFMNQLYALKCAVSNYIDLFPNILEVPDYFIALHDDLEDAITYAMEAVEEYVEQLNSTVDTVE